MSGFKIIAIKTGKNGNSPRNFLESSSNGVDIDYLKNLKPNTVYNFYNNYSFPFNDFTKINYDPNNDIQLYSVKLSDERSIPVNINAIVGENGSGKSTLIELLYWMNFNLGCKFGLLKTSKDEYYKSNNLLDLELLYQADNSYYILKFTGDSIDKLEIKFDKNIYDYPENPNWKSVNKIEDIPDFFYSIVINYSQYALNSLEVGEWINPLFHKNDGYQTPIVLNPMRNNGNININRERLLLSRRLQSNVLEKIADNVGLENSLRNLANGKIAKSFVVKYNQTYMDEINKKQDVIIQHAYQELVYAIKKHFEIETEKGSSVYQYFLSITINYVYYKLNKIVNRYPIYSDYKGDEKIINIDSLLSKIKESDSHTVFKIKGAILHLKYFNEIYKNLNFDYSFEIDIEYFSNLIHNEIIKKELYYVNTYMMSMPSFFNVDILPDKNLSMNNFSSGEKQKIFSLSSIIYHLINLNSVKRESNFTNYKFINIILDEIEMYYHPEWQRKYINDLLGYIGKINPDNLKQLEGINITFLTHSPFILSDIPSNNIIGLVEGNLQESISKKQTFGSNIYDLLANDFFMKNGFIGDYAMIKIKEVLDYVSEDYQQSKHNHFYNISSTIGDEVIREKLIDLLDDMNWERQNKKENLERQMKEIQKQLQDLNTDD